MSRFSTTGAPVSDRITLWEEYNEQELFGLRCTTLSDRSIMATQVNLEMDRIRLTHIQGNEHVIERSASSIRSHPVDSVMLCLLLQGSAFLYHGDGCETLSVGDAVVYDANRPFMYGFASDMRQVIVEVPRELASPHPAQGDKYRPKVLRIGDSAAATQAKLAAHSALKAFQRHESAAPEAEGILLDAFHILTGSREQAGSRVYLNLAEACIKAHLTEQLSVDQVAREVGISPRHLNRLFTEEGTTPGRFISTQRMTLASQLLRDRALVGLSIAEIGARVGLPEPTQFSRSFKRHFGVSPREYRNTASTGP